MVGERLRDGRGEAVGAAAGGAAREVILALLSGTRLTGDGLRDGAGEAAGEAAGEQSGEAASDDVLAWARSLRWGGRLTGDVLRDGPGEDAGEATGEGTGVDQACMP